MYTGGEDLNMKIFCFFIVNARSCVAIIPMTWANVTPDTGRLFDNRLSNMHRNQMRRCIAMAQALY